MFKGRIDVLKRWFEKVEGTVTAFSGGVDSSLVLFLSNKFLPGRTIACIANSASIKRKDYHLATSFCDRYDIPLKTIETKEVSDESYYSNPTDRCFFCKNHLYNDLQTFKKKYPGYIIINGTNKDDFGDYRPGLKAADKFKVRSPLAECSLGKDDIRELARYFKLPNWDKPASPCLSSRVPYGQSITLRKLSQIESAEEVLNANGFRDVRVRHFNNEARIEVPPSLIEELKIKFHKIEKSIHDLGFENCTIDPEGLISGKLNRNLKL